MTRFEGELANGVSLTARWTIYKVQEKELGKINRSNIYKPIAGQGYTGMVSALNLALADLSQEIADAINALSLEK